MLPVKVQMNPELHDQQVSIFQINSKCENSNKLQRTCRYANRFLNRTPAAGQVGMLVAQSETGDFNHFALLRSIRNLKGGNDVESTWITSWAGRSCLIYQFACHWVPTCRRSDQRDPVAWYRSERLVRGCTAPACRGTRQHARSLFIMRHSKPQRVGVHSRSQLTARPRFRDSNTQCLVARAEASLWLVCAIQGTQAWYVGAFREEMIAGDCWMHPSECANQWSGKPGS